MSIADSGSILLGALLSFLALFFSKNSSVLVYLNSFNYAFVGINGKRMNVTILQMNATKQRVE
jgi:hypothetical protein